MPALLRYENENMKNHNFKGRFNVNFVQYATCFRAFCLIKLTLKSFFTVS